MIKRNKFKIGQIVKDVITGYTGVVMAVTEYHKDGKPVKWKWIDEQRLTATGKTVEIEKYYRVHALRVSEPEAPDRPVSGVFQTPSWKN